MNLKEYFKLKGEIQVRLKDKDGNPKKLWSENWLGKLIRTKLGIDWQGNFILGHWTETLKIINLVVNAGKAEVAGLINEVTIGGFKWIAIGTGTAAAAVTDTALGAEITTGGGARGAAACTRVTTVVTNDTAQLVVTWNLTATFAVTESGCFDAASAGNMLCRQVFSAQNVVSGDSLEYTWKVSVA